MQSSWTMSSSGQKMQASQNMLMHMEQQAHRNTPRWWASPSICKWLCAPVRFTCTLAFLTQTLRPPGSAEMVVACLTTPCVLVRALTGLITVL